MRLLRPVPEGKSYWAVVAYRMTSINSKTGYAKSADSVIRKKNTTMDSILWVIFSWIVKIIVLLMIVTIVVFFCRFIWSMATNGGRKWYYYDPSKPWKGGYWTPLLPRTPPYNEYEWNPETCRYEHKETGVSLYSWQKPVTRHEISQPHAKKKRPEWLRFLFEETPATLLEKRRRQKWVNEREHGASR